MKLFKRKPTWTCGYYEVTVRGKPVKRVMLILQDPRYPRKFYELQLTQDQSEYIEVSGLADDSVSKELQELSRLQGKYGYRMTAGILDALFAVLLVLFVICVMSSRG